MLARRLFLLLFLTCISFLFFTGGALMAYVNLPPATQILKLHDSYVAWIEKRQATKLSALQPTDVNDVLKKAKVRAIANLPEQYNLFIMRYQHSAQLLDMAGHIVHSWSLPFSKAFPSHPHVKRVVPDDRVHFRAAHLYPNGDLLVAYEAMGDTPYGYGLIKLDKHSRVIWRYADNVHHNQYVDQSGNIYAVTQQFSNLPVHGFEGLPSFMVTDSIVILSPDGKEVERIPLLDAFRDSGFEKLMSQRTEYAFPWDISHTNSIMKLEPDIAAQFPLFSAGDILVSLRNIDTIAVIDHITKKVIWASKGIWKAQHSASFLNNGHILLFDNRGNITKNALRSRVLEINPVNQSVVWDYSGSNDTPLFSYAYGRAERLPNGNTLVTDTLRRRAFETTPSHAIVWDITLPEQYKRVDEFAPFNGTKPTDNFLDLAKTNKDIEKYGTKFNLATAIISATRYTPEQLPFLEEK
jgi:hypothetical protein